MTYELWDVTINRLLGEYAREDVALQEVLALVEHFGEAHADNLVLMGVQDDGLSGPALVARARTEAAVAAG